MLDRITSFISSLRLTVVLLGLALVLVFAGTLAQVHLGLYAVQSEFFRSFFVYWTPPGTGWKIPVLPGGWLIGWFLLVNLLAAHLERFRFTRKKIGIAIIHIGLILLLAGQFLTEIFQVESQMRLEVGVPKNYTEDSRRNELAVIDVSDPNGDRVVSVPESVLKKGGDIQLPGFPLTVRVKTYFPNSSPAGPMSGGGEKIKASNGIGQRLLFTASAPATRMDDENKPAALVEIVTAKGPIGTWIVSSWLTKHPWTSVLQDQVGGILGQPVDAPQSFSLDGRAYELALRPVRYYQPYTITLTQFKHDLYPGTDIPKNFSSKIHLTDTARGEDRDVLIYMNNPLRYRGAAFYQASYEAGDRVSILQVVRNPVSAAPYLACSLIGLGLAMQFLTHLYGFLKKTASRTRPQTTPGVVMPTAPLACAPRTQL